MRYRVLHVPDRQLTYPPHTARPDRIVQRQLKNRNHSIAVRRKTVLAQRNLGTIRERKKKKQETLVTSSGEMILRILRMRCVVTDRVFPPLFDLVLT